LAPQVLSRAVEDSGTVTSVLVPWNTCGAYISGVLGVPTAAYLPYCFFNILSPILDVIYGYVGFKVPSLNAEASDTSTDMTARTVDTTEGGFDE
jgi:NhaC family Na+:H+ antiporter